MKIKIFALIGIFIIIGVSIYLIRSSIPKQQEQGARTGTTLAATTTKANTITLAEVSKHADATSCWSVINGNGYDLTSWIGRHPGGSTRILAICGKDGSAAFNEQHGGQSRPQSELQTFYIGKVK